MNKGKEWLKAQVKDEERELKSVYDNYVPYEKVLIADDVNELINQLDEHTLPEIPKFVATWIKYQKRCKNGLFWALAKGSSKEKINAWLLPESYQEKVKNEALLLDAWNYGYTIEPEKKMLVTIKSYDQTESEFEIPESEAQKLIEELRGKHNEQ